MQSASSSHILSTAMWTMKSKAGSKCCSPGSQSCCLSMGLWRNSAWQTCRALDLGSSGLKRPWGFDYPLPHSSDIGLNAHFEGHLSYELVAFVFGELIAHRLPRLGRPAACRQGLRCTRRQLRSQVRPSCFASGRAVAGSRFGLISTRLGA